MQTGCNQDGDIRIGIARADFLQQNGERQLAGYGAGVVAGDQYDFMLALCQLAQAGCADGVFQRLTHQLGLALAGIIFIRAGIEHRMQVFFVHMQLQG